MPQNTWTNKDLDKFKTRPSRPEDQTVEDVMKSPAEAAGVPTYSDEPSVEALLNEARGTLRNADALEHSRNVEMGRAAGGGRGSLPLNKTDVAKGVFELLNPLGGGFDLGEQATGAEQFAASSLPFLTSGGVGAVKSLGKLGIQGGRAALGGIKTMMKGPALAEQFPRVFGGPRAATEIAGYAGKQAAQNPNRTLQIAREIAEETGEPVGQVLAQSGKVIPKPSQQALSNLARSGERAAQGRADYAASAQAAEFAENPVAQRAANLRRSGVADVEGVDPADFLGDRTTGYRGEVPDVIKRDMAGQGVYPLPNDARYMSEVDALAQQAGMNPSSLSALDDLMVSAPGAPPSAGNLVPKGARLPEAEPVSQFHQKFLDDMRGVVAAKPKPPVKRSYMSKRVESARAKSSRAKGPVKKASVVKESAKAVLPLADDVANLIYRTQGQ